METRIRHITAAMAAAAIDDSQAQFGVASSSSKKESKLEMVIA